MEKKTLPHYIMEISDEEVGSGVNAVALVDAPAIIQGFHTFTSQGQKFQTNEDRRLVMGPLMIADLPIYRNDKKGEYYVTFPAKTIERIAKKFMRNAYTNNVNLMHIPALKADGVYMLESFMIDSTRGLKTPDGFDTLTDGSWFGTYHVDNDTIWEQVKSGEFRGFSVEGYFDLLPDGEKKEDDLIREIEQILSM